MFSRSRLMVMSLQYTENAIFWSFLLHSLCSHCSHSIHYSLNMVHSLRIHCAFTVHGTPPWWHPPSDTPLLIPPGDTPWSDTSQDRHPPMVTPPSQTPPLCHTSPVRHPLADNTSRSCLNLISYFLIDLDIPKRDLLTQTSNLQTEWRYLD